MKKIILLWCLFISTTSILLGQGPPAQVFYLDSIPKDGIIINKGWKFHTEDDPQWANPTYNSNSWENIYPNNYIYYLPQMRAAQIGWLRVKLQVSKALLGKTVAFAIEQAGASEIYFNGKLVMQYGKVSRNYNEEETYNPSRQPLTIQLGDEPEQVLAVRYSFNKKNLYFNVGPKAFYLKLMTPQAAWDTYDKFAIIFHLHRTFICGVFILLAVLQLFIYLTYRTRKANLYLSIYAFGTFCCFIGGFLTPIFHTTSSSFFISGSFYIAAQVTYVFFLLIIYDLFNQPKKIWFKLLAGFSLLVIPLEFIPGPFALLLPLSVLTIYIHITRIGVVAYRLKYPGSKLFLSGQILTLTCFIIFNYIFVLSVATPKLFTSLFSLYLIATDITFLTPAIVISILLAREFTQNNISLKQKLMQVEELSQKNLAQEIEKQHMLAVQNENLEKQVKERTNSLSQSLENLKATQTQLIQSEKMASLGELTAGIATEIQNPLNFVNNFSEVNTELIDELKLEIAEGNYEEVNAIADDIKQNEQKINMHGKRADAIVKGMLQHSQSSSGKKEPMDINALADEYLRLSYHGLRAKDKSFNAELVTNFDTSLPKVNMIPQDMGRVLLNLFNNAFYSVNQKKKTAGEGYKPEVSVSTGIEKGQVVIKVKDNGVGIPDTIKDKIMQPFFTTKPTGEGTGLGLSLSYDILVKGHSGTIVIDSREHEYTSFVISLPLK